MAIRRMFSISVVDSDEFLELPITAQGLYFHLSMRADDDGFLNNARKILRMVGATEEDLLLLLERGFLLSFPSGVVAVTHWRVSNAIRKDRYTPTRYQEELNKLTLRQSGEYALRTESDEPIVAAPDPWQPPGNQMATTWQPDGNQLATQYRLG